MKTPRRILTIGHSYVVALNRRLAEEMAKIDNKTWDVHVIAPGFMHGDLRPIPFENPAVNKSNIATIDTYFSRRIHVMAYGRKLRSLLANRWDIIHAWEEPYIFAGAQIAYWTPKSTKLIYGTFQSIPKSYPPPFSWFERYAMRRASAWIAFGHTVYSALATRPGYRNRPSSVISVGVDTDVFRANSAARHATFNALGWKANGAPIVGYLGRFVEEKGIRLLMRVLDRVNTPWRALFVGGGPLESTLRQWTTKFPDRVRIATGVAHDGVPAYLNTMDILVAPSQSTPRWKEQFGRMLVEAFATGLPVIGSDSGEIPFVIRDSGLVVGEQDEVGWVNAISGLLQNENMRQELAERALQRTHDEFAWPVVARRHLDFFASILDGSRK